VDPLNVPGSSLQRTCRFGFVSSEFRTTCQRLHPNRALHPDALRATAWSTRNSNQYYPACCRSSSHISEGAYEKPSLPYLASSAPAYTKDSPPTLQSSLLSYEALLNNIKLVRSRAQAGDGSLNPRLYKLLRIDSIVLTWVSGSANPHAAQSALRSVRTPLR
jgi:hypothetical protein